MDDNKLTYVEANGIRFAYLEQGKGPLVLCLHGFPDTAHSYDKILPLLAGKGFRAVAPFMRGYHPTSLAKDGDYSVVTLARDVLALIDALGEEKAILIGHDWGALAAYTAANICPEKIEKLVFCCVPHLHKTPFTFTQLRKSWYVIFFQLPWWPEKALPKDGFAFIHRLYRAWSPNWIFTHEDVEPVKRALTGGGRVKAALGYYRAITRGVNKANWRFMSKQTTVPTLVLAGEADGSIDIEMFGTIRDCFIGELDFFSFEKVGHFPQREKPELFAEKVLNFIGNAN
jgi:pimeloyl-ACP methyl ester carboxylesterase